MSGTNSWLKKKFDGFPNDLSMVQLFLKSPVPNAHAKLSFVELMSSIFL